MDRHWVAAFYSVTFAFGLGCDGAEEPGPEGPSVVAGSAAAPPIPQAAAGASSDVAATTSPANTPPANAPPANAPPANTPPTDKSPASMSPPGTAPSGAPSGTKKPLAMNECGLNTGYAGDEYCILPPPPDKGFQMHIGPTDYKNIEPRYLLQPQQEATSTFTTTSSNDKKVFFYYRQFRMRPSAHHVIIAGDAGGGFGMGRRIGTSNNLAEDSPKAGVVAPENEGVGIPLEANSAITVNLHSMNVGDKPALRELWVNFWYKDQVTEPVEQMFQAGSVTFAVQPHQDTVLGPYTCPISGNGRMLWFYGHRHANNVRFSTWRVRGQQRELIYEAYDWQETLVLEYSSQITNPVANREKQVEGGWSGVLDLRPGDLLEWECHIINKTDEVLRFSNETFTGEMCIMDAELVGANCPAGRAQ